MSSSLQSVPTLITVPSVPSLPGTAALALIPRTAETALADLVVNDHSIVIGAEEQAVAHRLQFPLSSFHDDESSELDVEVEEFLNPKGDKGKGKAPAPRSTPASPAAAGPSTVIHGWLRQIGFNPGSPKSSTRYSAVEQKTNRRDLDTLAAGTAAMGDDVNRLRTELSEGLIGAQSSVLLTPPSLTRSLAVKAQLIGVMADTTEAVAAATRSAEAATRATNHAAQTLAHPRDQNIDSSTLTALIGASNKHSANTTALSAHIKDLADRVVRLEEISTTVTAVQATLDSHTNTLQVVLARLGAGNATTTDTPTNVNGKRSITENDDSGIAAKRQQLPIAIADPPTLAFSPYPTAPPAPDFASPMFAPALAAPQYPSPPPAAPSGSARAAPHGAAPQVPRDPRGQVYFGPMNWKANYHASPRNLISGVLGASSVRGVRFTSRRHHDDNHVAIQFDTEPVATWFVNTWNDHQRVGYECCVAVPLNV